VASQKHRQLLIEELNQIDQSPGTTPKEMITIVSTAKGSITFSNEDLPPGAQHTTMMYSYL